MNSFVGDKVVWNYYWTGGYRTKDKNWGYVTWRWWSDEDESENSMSYSSVEITKSMSYTSWNWLNGQPDGGDNEDRIAIGIGGKWYDMSADRELSFICTKKASQGKFSKLRIENKLN